MHRFASVSTGLLFAAHILLGCCAHHAHDHDSQAWHEQAACGGHYCGGSRSDHHDADQALSHDAGDCAGGPCSHGWCTYVKTDDTRIDRVGSQSSWFIFSMPPVGLFAAGCPSAESVSIATAEAHPARLYLLHCALVI